MFVFSLVTIDMTCNMSFVWLSKMFVKWCGSCCRTVGCIKWIKRFSLIHILNQEQGRASIRAGDLTTNYSFFWFGRDFKPCGSHSASKYRPSGMLGNKSHPQASGSLIHFLVCCYIPTLVFCWNIEASPLNSISHLLLPQEMGFCVHWHYWPKSLKPVPQLQALTLASAGSFEPSGTVCLSKKN